MGSDGRDIPKLVGRMIGGDQRATEDLMMLFGPAVWAWIRRYGSNIEFHDREDLFQEVWFRVFRFRDTFRRNESFKSWLRAIVRNCINDALRQKFKRREVLLNEDAEHVLESFSRRAALNDDPSPKDSAIEHRKRDLEEVIDQLSTTQRIVARTDLEWPTGKAPTRALAELLQKTTGAIRVARSRARAAIKRAMEARGHFVQAQAVGTWQTGGLGALLLHPAHLANCEDSPGGQHVLASFVAGASIMEVDSLLEILHPKPRSSDDEIRRK